MERHVGKVLILRVVVVFGDDIGIVGLLILVLCGEMMCGNHLDHVKTRLKSRDW